MKRLHSHRARAAAVLVAVAIAVPMILIGTASAAGWPSVFHAYGRFDGTTFNDPIDQPGGNEEADLSSGLTSTAAGSLASAFVATDGTNLMVRFRLKESPGNPATANGWNTAKGGLTGSAYVVQIAVDGAHVASVGFDGKPAAADYLYAAPVNETTVNGVTYTATNPRVVSTWNGTGVAGARVLNAGTTVAPDETFLDFTIPISDISLIVPAITTSTPLQFFFGTSAAANLTTINKDYMSNAGTTCAAVGCATVRLAEAKIDLSWSSTPTLVSGPTPPMVGQASVYDLTLKALNPGLNQLGDIDLSSVIPAGVEVISATTASGTATVTAQTLDWNPANLNPGQSATATVRVRVHPNGSQIGSTVRLNNGASATATDVATGTTSTASVAAIDVGPVGGSAAAADLGVALSGPADGTSGAALAYTASVSNLGPASSTPTLTLTTPGKLTLDSAVGTGWSCSTSGATATCVATAPLAAGANGEPITLQTTAGAAATGDATVSASVTGSATDQNSANQSAAVTTSLTMPAPTPSPTAPPTEAVTQAPSDDPTDAPTDPATAAPTDAPTETPTDPATEVVTESPTEAPTDGPSEEPSEIVTDGPSEEPSEVVTEAPSEEPSEVVTETPSEVVTDSPSEQPSEIVTEAPSEQPSEIVTEDPTPSEQPSEVITDDPTEQPSEVITDDPSEQPSEVITDSPTEDPTSGPSEEPTPIVTEDPTETVTEDPTETVTDGPSETVTEDPTDDPTEDVTEDPDPTIIPQPIAADDYAGARAGKPVTVDVLANDSAPSSSLDPGSVDVVQGPDHAQITSIDGATGVIRYLPDAGYLGLDEFVYKVCNVDGLCDFATVFTATPPVDLAIAIERVPGPLARGSRATYEVTVTNLGPWHADGPLELSIQTENLSEPALAGAGWSPATTTGLTAASAGRRAIAAGGQGAITSSAVFDPGLDADQDSLVLLTGIVDGDAGAQITVGAVVGGPFVELVYANNASSTSDQVASTGTTPTDDGGADPHDETDDPDRPDSDAGTDGIGSGDRNSPEGLIMSGDGPSFTDRVLAATGLGTPALGALALVLLAAGGGLLNRSRGRRPRASTWRS